MKIVSTINAHSSALVCVTRLCVNTLLGDSAGDRLTQLFKIDLVYSLEKMGVVTDLDDGNISTSFKKLSEEECQEYLVVREHFKAQFLKGFKKNQQGQVTRVQDFVMPSFTLKNKQVEVISNVSTSSSDLFSQLSSIMDKKIADIYKPMNDLKDQIDIMKKGKSIDDNYAFQTANSSAMLASIQEPLYGMPTSYFAGQTSPLQLVQPNAAGPVIPVQQTGQTGAMVVSPVTSTPNTSTLCWQSLVEPMR